jgi:hypothetical protein
MPLSTKKYPTVIAAFMIVMAAFLVEPIPASGQSDSSKSEWRYFELGGLVGFHYGHIEDVISIGFHAGLQIPIASWADSTRMLSIRGILEFSLLLPYGAVGADLKFYILKWLYIAPGYRYIGMPDYGTEGSTNRRVDDMSPARMNNNYSLAIGVDNGRFFFEALIMKTPKGREYIYILERTRWMTVPYSLIFSFGWLL